MDQSPPLSTLLSQVLVAFTIEFDNEFERRVPHRTADFRGSRSDPYLVSMVMWLMVLGYIPERGINAGELKRQSGLPKKQLRHLLERVSRWWGYVLIKPIAEQPESAWIIRLTAGGLKAIAVWRDLAEVIEQRWQKRFGHDTIRDLVQALEAVASQLDPALPDYLPILGYELKSQIPEDFQPPHPTDDRRRTLPVLLCKVLLAFAIEFETEANFSLALCANFLRLAVEQDIRVKDIPRLSGVSKEATAMALKRLQDQGLADVKNESSFSRFKVLAINAKGREKIADCVRILDEIETRWQKQLGPGQITKLRASLESLIQAESSGGPSLLMETIAPCPDNWRATVPPREVLPHFPMVLHRGGYPDGS
jgi:DNA-binding MarR family transcriptional regulator